MRVKVIKLDERNIYATDEERERVGKVFEALKYHNTYEEDEKYHDWYALGLQDGVWFIPAFCCEVVEDMVVSQEEVKPILNNKKFEILPNPHNVLLVEDGSVDVDYIESLGITCVVYRSGANKPEWL